jgi:hypothetical protein
MINDDVTTVLGPTAEGLLSARYLDALERIDSAYEREIHRRRFVLARLIEGTVPLTLGVEIAEHSLAAMSSGSNDRFLSLDVWWHRTAALGLRSVDDLPEDLYERNRDAVYEVLGLREIGDEPLRPLLVDELVRRGGRSEGMFLVFDDSIEEPGPDDEPIAAIDQVMFPFWEVYVEPNAGPFGRISSTSDELRLLLRISPTIETSGAETVDLVNAAIGPRAEFEHGEFGHDSVAISRVHQLGEAVEHVVDELLAAGDAANAIVGRFANLPKVTRIDGLD